MTEFFLYLLPLLFLLIALFEQYTQRKRVMQTEMAKLKEEIELQKEIIEKKKAEKEMDNPEGYNHRECNDLNSLFIARKKYIYEILNKKFDKTEMSFIRYDNGIKACEKYFYQNLNIADNNIVRLTSPETYSESLKKSKTLLKGIDKMMVELIKYQNSKIECNSVLEDLNALTKDIKTYYGG